MISRPETIINCLFNWGAAIFFEGNEGGFLIDENCWVITEKLVFSKTKMGMPPNETNGLTFIGGMSLHPKQTS